MEKKTDFKSLSIKSKFQYIWDYYRLHILITVLALCVAISLIHHYATYRDPILNVIMINCNDPYNTDDSGFDEFLEYCGLNSNKDSVSLDASFSFGDDAASYYAYEDLEILSVRFAVGDVDVFCGTGDVYLDYANEGALLDLSTVLSSEVLEEYEDCLLYSTNNGETTSYPCAIELTGNTWFTENNYYDSPCYVGIFFRTENSQNAVRFLEFLLEHQP